VAVTGNSIIVGVDGSAAAQSALRWAADEACIRQRTLLVVHAPDFAESRLIASAGEPAIRALDDLGERLLSQHAVAASTRQPGVLVTTLFSHSRAVDVLIDLSLDAGLLVVGTHGRGFESMLGSVSHRVAARAHCPVAVVPDARALWGRYQSPRIVVGVSSAPAGRLALEFAFGEAQHRNATVVAVRAWNRIDAAMLAGLDPTVLEHFERQAYDHLEHELAPLRQRFPQVTVEAGLAAGEPADLLLHAARTAQLVVVGCHHSDDRWSTRLGPVPTAILHRAPCPVVVVGQQSHPTSAAASTVTQPASTVLT